MSDTPRTDQHAGKLYSLREQPNLVPADFARGLEREVARLKEVLTIARNTLADCGQTNSENYPTFQAICLALSSGKITPHTQYICKCSNPYCQFCEGGLYACTVCGGMEGTLTTDCCGRRLTADEEDRIYNQHKLNFRDGQWREEDSFKQETHV